MRAVADEVAAAADLVKGKADGIPAALVRGLDLAWFSADAGGARPWCGSAPATGSPSVTSRRCAPRSVSAGARVGGGRHQVGAARRAAGRGWPGRGARPARRARGLGRRRGRRGGGHGRGDAGAPTTTTSGGSWCAPRWRRPRRGCAPGPAVRRRAGRPSRSPGGLATDRVSGGRAGVGCNLRRTSSATIPSTTANIAQRRGPPPERARKSTAPSRHVISHREPRRSTGGPDSACRTSWRSVHRSRPNGDQFGRTADATFSSGAQRPRPGGGSAAPSAARAGAGGARRARGGAARGSGARRTARAARRGRRRRPGCR